MVQDKEEKDMGIAALQGKLAPGKDDISSETEAKKGKKKKKVTNSASNTEDLVGSLTVSDMIEKKGLEEVESKGFAEEAEKSKKKKKKKKAGPKEEVMEEDEEFKVPYSKKDAKLSRAQDNSAIVNLKNWKDGTPTQTSPPTKTIDQQYQASHWDMPGFVVEYANAQAWTSKDDAKVKDLLWQERLCSLRKAAEVHRQVRKHAQTVARPGIRLLDLCHHIEKTLRFILQSDGLSGGQAFPTGVSLNNVAAHFSPNYGDTTVLKYGDVCKIDFGTHVNGHLVDSAFTVAFDPKYEMLLKASQESTEAGIRVAGIDARLSDIGHIVQETMESFEVEIDGKVYPVRSVRNLCGHSIEQYRVHGDKQVPNSSGSDPSIRMKEGEQYAIETFATTGKGYVHEDGECSHYMKETSAPRVPLKNPSAKRLLSVINDNFGTLAWCPRWVDDLGETGYQVGLNELVRSGIVSDHPPLLDSPGSFVAQYEHSFFLKPSGKEILTLGDDY